MKVYLYDEDSVKRNNIDISDPGSAFGLAFFIVSTAFLVYEYFISDFKNVIEIVKIHRTMPYIITGAYLFLSILSFTLILRKDVWDEKRNLAYIIDNNKGLWMGFIETNKKDLSLKEKNELKDVIENIVLRAVYKDADEVKNYAFLKGYKISVKKLINPKVKRIYSKSILLEYFTKKENKKKDKEKLKKHKHVVFNAYESFLDDILSYGLFDCHLKETKRGVKLGKAKAKGN